MLEIPHLVFFVEQLNKNLLEKTQKKLKIQNFFPRVSISQ